MQIEEIAAHCARANTIGMLHFLLHEVRRQSQWQTVEHSQAVQRCGLFGGRACDSLLRQLGSKCASHDPWVEISLHYLQVGPVRTGRSAACPVGR